jgi:hypothetical protein
MEMDVAKSYDSDGGICWDLAKLQTISVHEHGNFSDNFLSHTNPQPTGYYRIIIF